MIELQDVPAVNVTVQDADLYAPVIDLNMNPQIPKSQLFSLQGTIQRV